MVAVGRFRTLSLVGKNSDSDRPLLAVDVDGVISLFGFDDPPHEDDAEYKLIDGMVHCISKRAGPRLLRLAEHYELVWATGWEDRANDYLPDILGLPDDLPYLKFKNAQFGSSHWKLHALGKYAKKRPLAWIDDFIDDECTTWAHDREAPTLLVHTESSRGIEEAHVETLIRWVEDGYEPG
jgi:Swiss Army Knife RNA repair-like protein